MSSQLNFCMDGVRIESHVQMHILNSSNETVVTLILRDIKDHMALMTDDQTPDGRRESLGLPFCF